MRHISAAAVRQHCCCWRGRCHAHVHAAWLCVTTKRWCYFHCCYFHCCCWRSVVPSKATRAVALDAHTLWSRLLGGRRGNAGAATTQLFAQSACRAVQHRGPRYIVALCCVRSVVTNAADGVLVVHGWGRVGCTCTAQVRITAQRSAERRST